MMALLSIDMVTQCPLDVHSKVVEVIDGVGEKFM